MRVACLSAQRLGVSTGTTYLWEKQGREAPRFASSRGAPWRVSPRRARRARRAPSCSRRRTSSRAPSLPAWNQTPTVVGAARQAHPGRANLAPSRARCQLRTGTPAQLAARLKTSRGEHLPWRRSLPTALPSRPPPAPSVFEESRTVLRLSVVIPMCSMVVVRLFEGSPPASRPRA